MMVSAQRMSFKPRNHANYFRQSGSDAKKHILAWSPAERATNSRLDYLLRLTERLRQPLSRSGGVRTLNNVWAQALNVSEPTSCWYPYFSSVWLPNEGKVVQIRSDGWLLHVGAINPTVQWYCCDRCSNLTLFNLRGVCPTYRCNGTLHPCDPLHGLAVTITGVFIPNSIRSPSTLVSILLS